MYISLRLIWEISNVLLTKELIRKEYTTPQKKYLYGGPTTKSK